MTEEDWSPPDSFEEYRIVEQIPPYRAEFGVPDEYTPIGAITLGHRTEDAGTRSSATRRRRKPVEEVVHRGGW